MDPICCNIKHEKRLRVQNAFIGRAIEEYIIASKAAGLYNKFRGELNGSLDEQLQRVFE